MALRIRLQRFGRKKRPFFRVVVQDREAPRDGRFIEILGFYDPLPDPYRFEIKEDRVRYWLSQGAQPTETVASLLKKKGIPLSRG